MKVYKEINTIEANCVVCNKRTSILKVYANDDKELKIPVCEEHFKNLNVTSELNRTIKFQGWCNKND